MEKMQDIIERIKNMEQIMDEVWLISRISPERLTADDEIQQKILMLEAYLDSGQWMNDFGYDERGELPLDLKRGILSEDALYNLLAEVKWSREEKRAQ